MSNTKYIFVTGGVTSSLGKGIIAASLAKLLQSQNFKVTIQKFDPYINVDPGTLNPYEHGECFVTDDGAETDLDLGHYERFLNVNTSQANNVTTGLIYQNVIEKDIIKVKHNMKRIVLKNWIIFIKKILIKILPSKIRYFLEEKILMIIFSKKEKVKLELLNLIDNYYKKKGQ